MALIQDKDQRFKRLERKIGVFVAVAVALIALTIVFIGIRRDLFTPKTSVYFIADTGANLDVGKAVKFKGFVIGRVSDVRLTEQGRVEVALSINRDYIKFVREDSLAALSQEGIIGDYMIEIKGGGKGPVISSGGVIAFERTVSLADIASQFKDQFEDIIIEVRNVADSLISPEGHLSKSLENIHVLTDEIIETNRHLDGMLLTTEKLVTSVRDDLMPELRRTVRNAGNLSSGADKLISDIEQKINRTLDNVVAVSEDLKSASGYVPTVTRDAKEITDALKDSWPISGNIKSPKESALEIDSYSK